MPDETPKPILPKRPERRKPFEPKPPKKKDKGREDVAHDSTMLTMEAKACVLIAVEKDAQSAAIELNMTIEEVRAIMDSAPVRLFLAKLQEKELVELAKVKVRRYRKVGINRTRIEERLFDLMMLDPAETKGNIDGQVKAAAALADKFGFAKQEDPLAGKSADELKAIVRKGHNLLEGPTSVN